MHFLKLNRQSYAIRPFSEFDFSFLKISISFSLNHTLEGNPFLWIFGEHCHDFSDTTDMVL